jgi:hypothetical protein
MVTLLQIESCFIIMDTRFSTAIKYGFFSQGFQKHSLDLWMISSMHLIIQLQGAEQ